MASSCPFKTCCEFFRLFGAAPSNGLTEVLESYCLAPDGFRQCWRLAYRQDNSESPPAYLAPSGAPCLNSD